MLYTILLIIFTLTFNLFAQTKPEAQTKPGNLPVSTSVDANDANDEEQKKEDPLSLSYLKIARDFLSIGKKAKAIEYFEKASEEGDDDYARSARLELLSMYARDGKKNLDKEFQLLPEGLKAEGIYTIAAGWDDHFRKNPSKIQYRPLIQEYLTILSNRYFETSWGHKAVLQLASAYIKEERYEIALTQLLRFIADEKANNKAQAWYYIGQILEHSPEFRDIYKAKAAYLKSMAHEGRFAAKSARRLQYIAKYYLK